MKKQNMGSEQQTGSYYQTKQQCEVRDVFIQLVTDDKTEAQTAYLVQGQQASP